MYSYYSLRKVKNKYILYIIYIYIYIYIYSISILYMTTVINSDY